MNDTSARRLAWLAYGMLLVITAAWVYTAREPGVGFYENWPLYVRGWAIALVLLVPLFGRGLSIGSRILIGAAGLAAMILTARADLLTIAIVEWRLPRMARADPFCSWRPPVVPLLAYMGIGWLPWVLRAQAEARELLVGRGSAEAMGWQRRRLGLGVGVVLSFAVGEATLFFGAEEWQANHFEDLRLLAVGPILAMLVLELCVRASRTTEPDYPPLAWPDPSHGPRRFDRPTTDLIALARGHAALRWARVAGMLIVVSGLATLWIVGDHLLENWPPHFARLAVGGLALFGAVVLATAPRPRPDRRRRPPAPDFGLTPALLSLLDELERLRAKLERGRDGVVWGATVQLETALASLTDRERELLDSRHADARTLRAAFLRVGPLADSLDRATRRAIHAELLRFLACARSSGGDHPYRGPGTHGRDEPPNVDALDRALRRSSARLLGAVVLVTGVIATVAALAPEGLMIAVGSIGLVAQSLALGHARRMFAAAVPDPGVGLGPRDYSPAFERERARVERRRRFASVIAVMIAVGLCATILGAIAWATLDPWRWTGTRLIVGSVEAMAAIYLLAVARLMLPRMVDRLRERASVAEVGRLHRASLLDGPATLRIELVAQRLAWIEQPYVQVEALERCAELLDAATELGSLSSEDRDRLVERLAAAIAQGPAFECRQRWAIAVELATAELLLGR